jgi:hypothetical protein
VGPAVTPGPLLHPLLVLVGTALERSGRRLLRFFLVRLLALERGGLGGLLPLGLGICLLPLQRGGLGLVLLLAFILLALERSGPRLLRFFVFGRLSLDSGRFGLLPLALGWHAAPRPGLGHAQHPVGDTVGLTLELVVRLVDAQLGLEDTDRRGLRAARPRLAPRRGLRASAAGRAVLGGSPTLGSGWCCHLAR